MAKHGYNRGGGPGTYSSSGVRCTMDPPFKSGKNKGQQHDLPGTFSHARSGGGGGSNIPTRVTDPTSTRRAATQPERKAPGGSAR
jgi:hypothetical protein